MNALLLLVEVGVGDLRTSGEKELTAQTSLQQQAVCLGLGFVAAVAATDSQTLNSYPEPQTLTDCMLLQATLRANGLTQHFVCHAMSPLLLGDRAAESVNRCESR